jgi:hypothetical protein
MSNSSQSGLLGGGNEDDPVFGGFALVQQLDRQEFEHVCFLL